MVLGICVLCQLVSCGCVVSWVLLGSRWKVYCVCNGVVDSGSVFSSSNSDLMIRLK